jgi:serine phosphatase RsbU (regulator of sigma subunit)
MNQADLKEIKTARPSNIARVASTIIFLIIYGIYDYDTVLYFAIFNLSCSLSWFWLVEKKFSVYKKHPNLWFIPASIDIFFISASVYITGISYSPAILGYIYSTATSSVDLIRARGLFAAIGGCLAFISIIILAKLNIIPYVNIVNNSINELTLFSAILSVTLLFIACFTANSVIYQIYYQFNEKNNELSLSLDKINLLKLQQDADYALTARLMGPFGQNLVKSKKIQIEFNLIQKKTFTFKNEILQIGGDILLADEILFNDSKYILFMNGDAMGKSMQGACGALVLGSISKSIITRTQTAASLNSISPQKWLIESMSEMHRIFESFEGSMLASVFIGLIEEKTGALHYINTEHPSPILYRDDQSSFLNDNSNYSKIGTLGIAIPFTHVEFFQLIAGDMLFVGSDGKDDIILKTNQSSLREINQDEYLFSKLVQKSKGDTKKIINELTECGDFSDDLSILKISFLGNIK